MKSYVYESSDKTIKGKQLYLCDPEKNKSCKPLFGECGECKLTTLRAFAKTDDNGEPIKAPFIDSRDIDELYKDLINELHGENRIVKINVDIYYDKDSQDE